MNNGLTLGIGLTPFGIICEGHSEVEALKRRVRNAEMVERGTTLSLSDAEALTTTDIHLPTVDYIIQEKLVGWSIVVDVFHGSAHPVAVSIREAVSKIYPHLNRVIHQSAHGTTTGTSLAWRILYEMQQDYFAYLRELAVTPATVPVDVPKFEKIVHAVTSHRASCLAEVPHSWYAPLESRDKAEKPGTKKKAPADGGGGSSPLRDQSGTSPVTNARADRALMGRFRDSGHATITSMMAGKGATVPQVDGKDICLSWALKGSCNSNCKRKEQHINYSRSVVQGLHALMDTCGVANAQP